MKYGYKIACGIILMLGASALAQTQPSDDTDLAPGFKLRTSGGIDIGDLYAEVVHFDDNWKEVEEHDVFQPTVQAPATQPSSKLLTGDFAVGAGTFKLTEQIDPTDAGIHFSATMSSDKALATNEMSVALNLPVATFGGKKIVVDQQAVAMPAEPAAKGEPHIFDKEDAKEIDLPTAAGTLIITGDNLNILVQDDREWGDPRYGLRIRFTPGDGQITSSKIDLQMKWKPAESK
ncbi:MAG: hypothetical protein ABSB74_13605 [Tepidisphaeraceae bacterium]